MSENFLINSGALISLSSSLFLQVHYKRKINYIKSCTGIQELKNTADVVVIGSDDMDIVKDNIKSFENSNSNNIFLLMFLAIVYAMYIATVNKSEFYYLTLTFIPFYICIKNNALLKEKIEKFENLVKKYNLKKRGLI